MKLKLALLFVLSLVLFGLQAGIEIVEPEISAELAVSQVEDQPENYQRLRAYTKIRSNLWLLWCGLAIVATALFKPEIKKGFQHMKTSYLSLCLLACVALTGCIKPYDVPEFVEIESSETAFVIPLEGNTNDQKSVDSESYYKDRMVAVKKIQIPHKWVQTGRWMNAGEWVPSVRVLKVNREPVTREWTAESHKGTSSKDEAIWVESEDSVGFSTGIACTARIPNNESAIKFLYNHSHGSLEKVMDTEIRNRIQKVMAREAANAPMDTLRELKNEMLDAVEQDVVPYFQERGIEITAISQRGGFTYENPDIQKAIDKVFEAQQDEEVAKAEAKAAEQRKIALQLKGEGEAAQILEEKRGEAEGIKLVADAKKYEIEQANADLQTYLALKQLEIDSQRLEKWDGKYPQFMMGGDNLPQLLMGAPQVATTP